MDIKWKQALKRSLALMLAAVCLLGFAPVIRAQAMELAPGSITVKLADGQSAWLGDIKASGAVVDLYQVAKAENNTPEDSGFKFVLNSAYSSVDLTKDADKVAAASAEITKGSVSPTVSGKNLEEKITVDPGLYLMVVHGSKPESKSEYFKSGENGIYTVVDADVYEYRFTPQLISVPTKAEGKTSNTADEGEWITSLTVVSKVESSPAPARLNPPIKKLVEGDAPAGELFTFQMIPHPMDAPMPEPNKATLDESTGILSIQLKAGEEYEFGWISYDEDDIGKTYNYTLKEIPGNDPNWTYDANQYTIKVTVKMSSELNADGHPQIVLDVDGKEITEQKLDSYVFTNKYQEPEKKTPHLSVNKTVTSTPKNGKKYTVGETISYTVTVINDGDLTLTDVKVDDELTGDHWTVDSLDPGAEKSFTTSYKVKEADAKAGFVTNEATASGKSPDPDNPDVPATPSKVTVPVEKPDVVTPKTGDDSPLRFWVILAGISAVCIVALAIVYKKKQKS